MNASTEHPRDRFITVFGRKPVMEALSNPELVLGPLRLDRRAKGDTIQSLVRLAKKRKSEVPASRLGR